MRILSHLTKINMPTLLYWLVLASVAGLLLTLSFAPYHYAYLSIPALMFLYRSWTVLNIKSAMLVAYLFGLGLFASGIWWTYISIHDFGGADAISASLISFLLIAVWSLFPALVAFLVKRFVSTENAWLKIAAIAWLWVAVEYLRGYWLLNGFPWLQIAYSQIETPLAGFAPLIGVYGVGFLLAVSAFVVMEMISNKSFLKSGLLFLLLCWGTGAGLKNIAWTHAIGEPISITLVQGNIAQSEKWQPEQRLNSLKTYQALTEQHWQDSQIIIWPETAIPAFYHQVQDFFLKPLAVAAKQHHVDLVVSMPTKGEGKSYFNSAVVLGAEQHFYHKNHLLPFGEYLPLQPLSGWILDQLNIPLGDFTPGADKQTLLFAAGYPFITTICYEDAFGEQLTRQLSEAAFIVNVTNDAWFGDTSQAYQHFQMAQMRALETGRYLVRATNTGVTGFIAPDGRILKQAPTFTSIAITEHIVPMAGITPYAYLGDNLIFFIILLGLFCAYGWQRFKVNH